MEPSLERAHRRAQTGSWLWRIGAVLAIVAAVFCLGACVPRPIDPAPEDSIASKAWEAVGTCWNSDDAATLAAATWVDGESRSCSDPHNVITLTLVEVSDEGLDPYVGSDGAVAGPTATFGNPEFAAEARALCVDAVREILPGPSERPQRLHALVGLPGIADWAAGSRWARCDMTAFQIGSPWDNPSFEPLPDDFYALREDSDNPSGIYDLCLSPVGDVGDAGPGDPIDMTLSACDATPRWKLVSTESLSTISTDGITVFLDPEVALATCSAAAAGSGLRSGTFSPLATVGIGGTVGASSAFCWADFGA